MMHKTGIRDIVVAGCTPRIAETFFGKYGAEIVNIREQAAYVGHGPEKMRALIEGAVAKKRVSKGRFNRELEIASKDVLIIGAGIAGMEAARKCADSGLNVYLIDREQFIGGMVEKLDRIYPEGVPVSHTLNRMIFEILRRNNIKIITGAELLHVEGNIGNYKAKLKVNPNPVKACNACGECVDACPVVVRDGGLERKAIYFVATYPNTYAVDWSACDRCGKCAEVCEEIDLSVEEEEIELDVGAIIVATGLEPFDASKIENYGHGRLKNVYTALEFEREFVRGELNPKSVVIINCAGSRDEHYLPYCSRVCCAIGLKEAKLVKDISPETEVYLTYVDMRTQGIFESLYTDLRAMGVNMIRGKPSEVYERNGRLVVRTEDMMLDELLNIEADCVVLSTGFVPPTDVIEKLGLPVENDFPLNYVCSSLSIDANPHGVFFAGCSSYPKDVTRSLISADYIAGNLVGMFGNSTIEVTNPVADIDSDICGGKNCGVCSSVCPYSAVVNDNGSYRVDITLCRGCGICASACPSGANQLEASHDDELLSQVDGILNDSAGKVVAFLCENCAYQAADNIPYERLTYSEDVMIVRVPCTGRVDAQVLLRAYTSGAKGVLVAGCCIGACHFVTGNVKAHNRVLMAKRLIQSLGIDPDRLRIEWIGQKEPRKLVRVLSEMTEA
jgi:heterodisulfide reductase subunit A